MYKKNADYYFPRYTQLRSPTSKHTPTPQQQARPPNRAHRYQRTDFSSQIFRLTPSHETMFFQTLVAIKWPILNGIELEKVCFHGDIVYSGGKPSEAAS